MSARVLSLFSGAGGMDIGLEMAGFENIGCLEFDETAQQTLALNRPNWELLLDGDVLRAADELSPSAIGIEPGELDLLAGGPPCQPFSTAAQWSVGGRRGMDDERASTVHALLDLVDAFLPKAVLIENVLGFVHGANSALPAIEKRMSDLHARTGHRYRLSWKLLNAANYGVPQNRKRVIIVLLRDFDNWTWPAEQPDQPPSAWDAIGDLATGQHRSAEGKWGRLLPSIPAGSNYQWLTASGGGQELFGYRTKFWNFLLKLDPLLPSWTLSASPGPSTGPFHWNNGQLTTLERMRIQTIPDEWQLTGDIRSQTKLIGNATPSRLSWVLGRHILAKLGVEVSACVDFPVRRNSDPAPRLEAPKPVPAEYEQLLGMKPAHPGHGLGPAGVTTLAGRAEVEKKAK